MLNSIVYVKIDAVLSQGGVVMKKDTVEDKCNPLVLANLRQRVMPQIKEKFKELKGDTRGISGQELSDLSETLIATAMTLLALKFGVNDIDFFGKATVRKAFEWIVGELNSVLPVDHPYIISIINVGDEPQAGFAVLERKTLPGWRDFVDSWKVPIAWSPTPEQAEHGLYQVKRILSPDGETILS